jgi:DNA-nicking Smr family endonuclease
MNDELENDELFLQEMGDVKPINVEKKMISRRSERSEQMLKARREAATQVLAKDDNHLASGDIELLDAYYPLEFKRSGVQHGVFKKLKQGKYPCDGRLDLHRMTVDKARKEVFEFIKQSMQYDLRTLMIIHGKGHHSGEESALLKSYVNKWLPDMEEVQAFCSAQKQHGGVGAVYVLLRKSDKKKQENRDRINRGRVDI